MQPSDEKQQPDAYRELLDAVPMGAKHVVGSEMSQKILGMDQREPVNELKALCGIFEGYKQTGDSAFISKAEDYLAVWSREYAPDTENKGIQISLDQRHFPRVFVEVLDCWDALSNEGKTSAAVLAQKVADAEEIFWSHNTHHNNRFSYSTLTRITAYGVLKAAGVAEAAENQDKAANDFYGQVWANVHEDGSTLDFTERDSVHYQVFNQVAWETSRRYLLEHSVAVPEDVSAKLDASLAFSLRYITGDETHLEFVNSTHARDAEIQGDKVGRPFDKDSFVARQLLNLLES